jgi:succinate dehydrogenase / fumarate reductase cytochrome b subunit
MTSELTFVQKHEFLLRRVHSLTGLVPVGLYMCVHLVTNASILNGVEAFQNAVYAIHSLGNALVFVEWGFIFLPLLFHAIFGVYIAASGQFNTGRYAFNKNWRYVAQRVTGLIAFVFIVSHVAHMHGWFHVGFWEDLMHSIGLARFRAYNAASTAALAMQANLVWPILYAIGIAACVFHFANGVWTMGITWGVWVSPQAQRRADMIVSGLGVLVLLIGFSALGGFMSLNATEAEAIENRMYKESVKTGRVVPNEKKLTNPKLLEEAE